MEEKKFLFKKRNFQLMLLGIAFIVTGMVLMSGGGASNETSFNPEIFNARRITIAPILILIGFIIEVFAIMNKQK